MWREQECFDVVWKCWRVSFLPAGMHRGLYTCTETALRDPT